MARRTSADPRLGTTVADYRIVALAGRGGMSVVYRARDERLGRDVALKLLAPELTDDDQFRRRFLHESQVAASLHHPNIVPVYAAGEADGILYLAMRYVEGADLKALLRRESTLAPERALALLGQVAAALDTAQSHGLVHRDVKPANILLEGAPPEENGYLADFGLTKTDASHAATMTGQLVGTLDYVAPEQIRGQTLDGRADIYSLACVLYECLAGSAPFASSSEVAVLYSHLQDPPPPASERHPELPPAIDAVLSRALAKQPEDRQSTAGELIAEAGAALSKGVVPPSSKRWQRWRPRRWIPEPRELVHGRALPVLVAVIVAIGLAVGAEQAGAFARSERESFDVRMSIRGGHDAPDVVLVGLDESGNPFPLLSSRHARVIERLSAADAKVIADDVKTLEISPPGYNNALISAVSSAGNVVIGTTVTNAQGRTLASESDLVRRGHARVGNWLLSADADDVVRRVPYEERRLTSFAVTTASLALGRPVPRSKMDGDSAWIDYAGPPGTIKRVSFHDVLNRAFAPRVRGKIALVASSPVLQDFYATPVGLRMTGLEVQANAIQTALDGFPLRDAPAPIGFLAIVALGIGGMLAALRLRWLGALLAALGLAALYLVLAQVAFDAGIVMTVSYPLAALAAATFFVALARAS